MVSGGADVVLCRPCARSSANPCILTYLEHMKISHHHPAVIWAFSIGLAIMIAYAAAPVASSILIAAEEWAGLPQAIGSKALMAVPGIAFVVSLMWLARMPSIRQRIGKALKTAGILLLLSLPVLIVVAIVENMQPAVPGDHGAGAAAIYLVFLFGGAYGILGLCLLIAGVFMLRRERRAATPQ